MRISDWSSDVCSSDLGLQPADPRRGDPRPVGGGCDRYGEAVRPARAVVRPDALCGRPAFRTRAERSGTRSEEHTSELQSLMRISYAVFCLKKKNVHITKNTNQSQC